MIEALFMTFLAYIWVGMIVACWDESIVEPAAWWLTMALWPLALAVYGCEWLARGRKDPCVESGMCSCGDRPWEACPGEWEPGCDLGNNPKFVRAYRPDTFPVRLP